MLDFYAAPPTSVRLARKIAEMKDEYGGRLRVFPIGRSFLGRELWALAPGPARGCAVFFAGVHGAEWLNVLAMVRFTEELLRGELPLRAEGLRLAVVPCLNPDGTDLAIAGEGAQPWQANARGVDLNHNFDAGWQELRALELREGISGPGPTRFGGPAPFSEPESRAAARFCLRSGARSVYAFHSQGEEIYWRYGPRTPGVSRLMAELLAGACGYAVASPSGAAAHGGLKDWFIRRTGRPGFTLETGRGRNPLPLSDFPELYDRLRRALCLAASL